MSYHATPIDSQQNYQEQNQLMSTKRAQFDTIKKASKMLEFVWDNTLKQSSA